MVKATAEKVEADMSPPNYRGAVKLIGTVKAKKDRISSINGEIGGIWDRVEGFKVNKKAAKIYAALDNMEAKERNDVIRSLEGLCASADWDRSDLLEERNNDNVVHLRDNNTGGGGDDDDDDLDAALDPNAPKGDDIDEALAPEKPPTPGAEALAKARERLDGGKRPYTGNDDDLADRGSED
jgi:hypothetical protein